MCLGRCWGGSWRRRRRIPAERRLLAWVPPTGPGDHLPSHPELCSVSHLRAIAGADGVSWSREHCVLRGIRAAGCGPRPGAPSPSCSCAKQKILLAAGGHGEELSLEDPREEGLEVPGWPPQVLSGIQSTPLPAPGLRPPGTTLDTGHRASWGRAARRQPGNHRPPAPAAAEPPEHQGFTVQVPGPHPALPSRVSEGGPWGPHS